MDQVERIRSMFGLEATPDTSYDQVERMRSVFGLEVAPDTSYDQVERMRLLDRTAAPDTSATDSDMSIALCAALHPATISSDVTGTDMSSAAYAALHRATSSCGDGPAERALGGISGH